MRKTILLFGVLFTVNSPAVMSGWDGVDAGEKDSSLDQVLNSDIVVQPKGEAASWDSSAQNSLKENKANPFSHSRDALPNKAEAVEGSIQSKKLVMDKPANNEKTSENIPSNIQSKEDAESYFDKVESSINDELGQTFDAQKEYALSLNEEVNPKGYDSRLSITDWTLSEELSLRDNLQKWCDIEGWDLVWDTGLDTDIAANKIYTGNFLVAVTKLFYDLHESGSHFTGKGYKGNKVVRISYDLKSESKVMVE